MDTVRSRFPQFAHQKPPRSKGGKRPITGALHQMRSSGAKARAVMRAGAKDQVVAGAAQTMAARMLLAAGSCRVSCTPSSKLTTGLNDARATSIRIQGSAAARGDRRDMTKIDPELEEAGRCRLRGARNLRRGGRVDEGGVC
jgi:hypothetical protein